MDRGRGRICTLPRPCIAATTATLLFNRTQSFDTSAPSQAGPGELATSQLDLKLDTAVSHTSPSADQPRHCCILGRSSA